MKNAASNLINSNEFRKNDLVRKGGFEPPRLAAPPPQDGASASSATSARGEVKQIFYCAAISMPAACF